MLLISEGMREGKLPPVTVYVDGLAREVSTVYENLLDTAFFNFYVQPAPVYEGLSFEEACEENLREADCVLATSGMLMEGTPSFVYARLLAESKESAILFSGYMVEESFGYKLLNDSRLLREFRCHVTSHHFSAHSDSTEVERLLKELSPKNWKYVHGYPPPSKSSHHAFNREVVRF
jgi:predicted metal-dependent RNase